MNISNTIAKLIMDMLEADGGSAEMQRNELAQLVGCVPSQINYVIASRFTPEQGYIVESRRGGGGYIRITRIGGSNSSIVMHVLNHIGMSLDERTARAHIINLAANEIIAKQTAKIMLAAVSDSCYRQLNQPQKDEVRAAVFKQMLMQTI